MKALLTILLSILLLTPGHGQYTQNIDSMSRKEIREFLTSDSYSGKAKSLMRLHKVTKEVAIAGYGISAIIFFLTAALDGIPSGDGSSNDVSYDTPAMVLLSSFAMTVMSEVAYVEAKKAHRDQYSNYKNPIIRDDSLILNSLSY